MKRTLIITWDMVPFARAWGSCQRIFFLANFLEETVGKVDLICSSNAGITKNVDSYDIKFNIHAFDFKGNNVKINNPVSPKQHSNTRLAGNNKRGLLLDIPFKIVNFVFNEGNYRNSLKVLYWIYKNKKNINNLINKSEYETIIISGPPHTLFSILFFSKMKTKRVLIDYRDPWNLWRSKYPISQLLERKILKLADNIVVTNANIKNDICEKYNINLNKCYVVENGYSKESWSLFYKKIVNINNMNRDFFTISYVGGIGLKNRVDYRDCTELIEAYKEFSTGRNCRLNIVGVTDISEVDIDDYIRAGITIKGQVAEYEAFYEMVHSDILILLHTAHDNSGKYIVSAKLYDYLISRRFILSIGRKDSLHSEIISSLNIGDSVQNERKLIKEILCELYNKWFNGTLEISQIDVERYSREFQNEVYRKLIVGGK